MQTAVILRGLVLYLDGEYPHKNEVELHPRQISNSLKSDHPGGGLRLIIAMLYNTYVPLSQN